MKNIIIATITTGFLAISASSTSAQQITAKEQFTNNNLEQIPPVTLVQLGYQGYFNQQGIPSNEAFRFGVKTGKVNAEKLVQSAIDKGRLSRQSLNDTEYLTSVQSELNQQNRY